MFLNVLFILEKNFRVLFSNSYSFVLVAQNSEQWFLSKHRNSYHKIYLQLLFLFIKHFDNILLHIFLYLKSSSNYSIVLPFG